VGEKKKKKKGGKRKWDRLRSPCREMQRKLCVDAKSLKTSTKKT
jgi:hypothetical protein